MCSEIVLRSIERSDEEHGSVFQDYVATDNLSNISSGGPMVAWILPHTTSADRSSTSGRKKRWHSKTRTGCLTCRRRRVKCDEQRPSCVRCIKVYEECIYESPAVRTCLAQYRPSNLPHASRKFDISSFEFFIRNTVDTLSTPPSTLVDHRPPTSLDPDMATARFWKSLGLPLVHTEPLILDLVILLAKDHRKTLTQSERDDEDLLEAITIMSKIVKTRPRDVVVVGSMLTSAFDVLHSTTSKDYSRSEDGVHAIAFTKLLLQSSDAVFEYIKPITDITRAILTMCACSQVENIVEIPDDFLDLHDARYYFAEILTLALPKIRPPLERWLRAMSNLFQKARGKDWDHSKVLLTLFIYGRHILTMTDVALNGGVELDEVWDAVEKRILSSSMSSAGS